MGLGFRAFVVLESQAKSTPWQDAVGQGFTKHLANSDFREVYGCRFDLAYTDSWEKFLAGQSTAHMLSAVRNMAPEELNALRICCGFLGASGRFSSSYGFACFSDLRCSCRPNWQTLKPDLMDFGAFSEHFQTPVEMQPVKNTSWPVGDDSWALGRARRGRRASARRVVSA